jgi:glycosyltransferase involved in cell wall biosynthesis
VTAPPLLTVGLPTFNGGRYLRRTLDSLAAQEFDDFELLISDNGSTDDTEAICREHAGLDGRVRYERATTNRGAAWNYNNVLALARGRYFKWAADDDICEPSFLASCVAELERSPGAVLAYPQTLLIDADGAPIAPLDDRDLDLRSEDPVSRLSQLLRHRVEWHPVFGVIRTDVLRTTRGIGPFILADAALLAELALRGCFHQVPERSFLRRYHDQRSIAANPSFEAHAAWYRPDRPAGSVWPQARLVRELLSRALEAPLPAGDRGRAVTAVLRWWAAPNWRLIGGEAKLAVTRPVRVRRAQRAVAAGAER